MPLYTMVIKMGSTVVRWSLLQSCNPVAACLSPAGVRSIAQYFWKL